MLGAGRHLVRRGLPLLVFVSSLARGCDALAMYALIARPGLLSTWTDGTQWLSVNRLSTLSALYMDHADAAGLEHGEALLDAADDAALAEHDLAGHDGRVERAGRRRARRRPSAASTSGVQPSSWVSEAPL